MELPVIGITMGDPAGVGPEIIVKALSDPQIFKICRPLVLGDQGIIAKAAQILGLEIKVNVAKDIRSGRYEVGAINVLNLSNLDASAVAWGKPDERFGKAVVGYIKAGTKLALEGETEAITTAPINKEVINRAGYAYAGHTELFAELTHTKDYVMMLTGEKLRVALVTTHCRLKDVAALLNTQRIFTIIKVTNNSLKEYFAISKPRIAVASLNPHAGEGGMFGDEEDRIIAPAINRAKDAGIHAIGPLPSDTLFYYASRGDYDVVVCMYHDQGLIPLKLLSFQNAVNVTLGLPIIRTSVDHGTAYDIAGTGKANPESLKKAITLAASMANKRRKLSKDMSGNLTLC
ncbi:MAG: 4-hydroxythreonine-4-phosphate dehydrogenase PdxA [Deltaproteobacteria bacterium CG12_big_fil_rev_8_21_14_0_65_43_10]|nr:MAG: 4-hydroxythreonine-4-phosphate dehydrogenase PdxA [Deltaproteobacteria bacterium CG2_30_43_15]PIQ45073.1 MAG: 4-hydroxythreonine-4-phosphate dehydrogenase PdxA [Deltaproteobacteria bacterium CG12_big_fil_rev_8_21_14_0_65_43_10]PIU86639.1 MAG: 4-hydroxythreonine-4-phosphate dehydrogenase PdxA [Deltaproteobacteria bacterium CG06_land_8_20_14_3_00_44_19]PIX26046.1 MAG: 4-hydroxythreonine-4-phosphate dehydrogenase PdxA [Deltaproteobacteria bacterium CG_4_8_14_3_um_filter_43_13]PIZ18367.1 MA